MNAINTNQINVIEVLPAIYTVSTPTEREINYLVSWVRSVGKIDYYTVSMILESAVINAALKQGLLVEVDGCLLIPGEQAAEAPATRAQDELDRQISEGKQSIDPAYRQHAQMLEDCLEGDWLDKLVKEDLMNLENELEVEKAAKEAKDLAIAAYHKALALDGQILAIEGLKLKNLDRNDSYWLFVGNYYQCEAAQLVLLHDHLVSSALKPNSKDGTCWKLIVDRIVRGYIETRYLQEAIEQAA